MPKSLALSTTSCSLAAHIFSTKIGCNWAKAEVPLRHTVGGTWRSAIWMTLCMVSEVFWLSLLRLVLKLVGLRSFMNAQKMHKNQKCNENSWDPESVTKVRWGLTAFALGLRNSQQARQHQVRSISNFVTRPFSMDEVAFGILPECQSRRQLDSGVLHPMGYTASHRLTDLLIEKHIKACKNPIFHGMWLLPVKCFEFLQQVFAAVLSSLGLHSPTWAERVRPLDRTSALL